jgi:hypothetical protein
MKNKLMAFALLVLVASPLVAQDFESSEHRKMKSRADGVFRSFIFRLHSQRLEDAYGLHSADFKASNTYEAWAAAEREFYAVSGGGVLYRNVLSNWHKSETDDQEPVTYATFGYSCEAPVFTTCNGVLRMGSENKEDFYIDRHSRTYELTSADPASATAENQNH